MRGFTAKEYTVEELAKITGSSLVGNKNLIIKGVDNLDSATPSDASFLANPKYKESMLVSKAGVVCISNQVEPTQGKTFLISDNPSRVFQKIVELYLIDENNISGFAGIHPTAVIHPSAHLGSDVLIGPYVVIDKGCSIGDGTQLFAHVSVGAGVSIGSDCIIHPHVVIREKCMVGHRVILQPGSIIGSCGFGFTTDAKGTHSKLDQLGNVVIEDDVEIGSCTIIDRARFKSTTIGRNSKIDNLVQIAHNVQIGPSNLIVAQSGIAGSTQTGRNVVFGAQSGIVGHIKIADGFMLASRGGVSKSMPTPGVYNGTPCMPIHEFNKQQVYLRKIEKYVKKIEELEKRLSAVEQN
jgi:UDP-3-O-[3-hydroxymyristoyl] glucosamine N-acyltransferase